MELKEAWKNWEKWEKLRTSIKKQWKEIEDLVFEQDARGNHFLRIRLSQDLTGGTITFTRLQDLKEMFLCKELLIQGERNQLKIIPIWD